ncbi:MAG TPA: class I SAM-dependent methyltransferase [Alphaproteobacteria bacterium]|nr:class I SAM-dependent methyltransferase [Alphaproteobacteria bacterium]
MSQTSEKPADKSERWRRYYEKTRDRPPRGTLLLALERFEEEGRVPGFAVDLGSGGGRDVVELLRRGWRVLAVDAEATAIEAIRKRPDLPATGELETLVSRFEDAEWPACDLVNSSFALPLCPRDRFPAMWRRIIDSLRPGGRFSGQLYGERDDWAGDPSNTHLTRAEAEALLDGLEVERFEEEEDESTTPRGTVKHWHVFHIVARKPG